MQAQQINAWVMMVRQNQRQCLLLGRKAIQTLLNYCGKPIVMNNPTQWPPTPAQMPLSRILSTIRLRIPTSKKRAPARILFSSSRKRTPPPTTAQTSSPKISSTVKMRVTQRWKQAQMPSPKRPSKSIRRATHHAHQGSLLLWYPVSFKNLPARASMT